VKNLSIYIHIPFCDHKCIYCDFYSIITTENQSNFINAVTKEIGYYAELYGKNRIVKTIYFGGGTPSYLPVQAIKEVIENIKNNFKVYDDCEITLETNPGTVNKSKLKELKNTGINRISIGIQSFLESDLDFLTRIHDKKTAIATVENAADVGFKNISIDLIFNLPGQTKSNWLNNLSIAVELPVVHISAYSLIIERGTILNKMILDGKVNIGDEDFDADLYETTIRFLNENGFEQYEVSNFCKSGFESKHNLNYWNYGEYIGFGPSAHSFIKNKRWWNFSSLKKYIDEINKSNRAVRGSELLTPEQMLNEFVMLTLRSTGININEIKKKFKKSWLINNKNKLNGLEQKGLIIFDDNRIKLTPKGYLVCDEILLNLN